MQENYDKCLETILHHEGGYVNHPSDPGGETNMGVTKKVYVAFGGTKDMKDLEFNDVAPIYRKNYWDRLKCDNVPVGLDLCLFDFGVNAGTGRSAKFLQRMIGTTADGGIGPNTLKKLADYIDTHGLEETIKELLESYRGLSEEVMSDRMSVIINDDIFTSARVNLSNLVF